MTDATAQTEPLSQGQQIVVDYKLNKIGDPCELAAAIDKALDRARELATPKTSVKGFRWRCFHCNDAFNNLAGAREHFGATLGVQPACQIAAHEGHLVTYIRKLEDELQSYRSESNDILKSIMVLEADRRAAIQLAAETGYDRGLLDGIGDPKRKEG